MDDKYYEEMSRQVEELQRQNHILKLEHELRSFGQKLGEMSGLLSTPAPVKDELGLGSRKVWSDIPKGRPDDAHGAEAGLSEAEGIDSQEIPDRFVTNRKKPASSGSKSKDVNLKILCNSEGATSPCILCEVFSALPLWAEVHS